MADQQNTPNPTPQGGDGDGGKEKLFFGKYRTLEDAEVAFKEGERRMHEATQQAAQWKEIAERVPAAQSSDQGYGQGGSYRTGYAPVESTANPDQAAQVLARFYQDPMGVLNEVQETAAQKAAAKIQRQQAEENDKRARIQAWLAQNQDLAKHGDLLDAHVRQTDGRLAVETRLNLAAEKVRDRLKELRGEPREANPNPQDYIPGPSGSREGAPAGGPAPVSGPADQESQLAAYAAQRNTGRIKTPGRHGR